MSRVWVLRAAVGAVLALLVAAWALGMAGSGGTTSTREEADIPSPADSSTSPDVTPSGAVETTEPRPSKTASPSEEAVDEPTPDVVAVAETEPAAQPDTSGQAATPKPPTKTAKPSPTPSSKPTPTPTPTQPGEQCTDLMSVVDCLLAPITTQP